MSSSFPEDPSNTLQKPKKLVICCDGTWKNSDSGFLTGSTFIQLFLPSLASQAQLPTNITRLARALKPTDSKGHPQIVFYQPGVGSVGKLWAHVTGGALGAGLGENIREAYSFLALNYTPGDEIYLLGFSRGAYTARAVGGLIADMGLLTRDGLDHFYDVYNDWKATGLSHYNSRLAKNDPNFHITECANDEERYLAAYRTELERLGYSKPPSQVPINAIGVFETVGALGIPILPVLQRLGLPYALRPYRFLDTRLGSNVRNAFQALALDERRSAYWPTLWEQRQSSDTEDSQRKLINLQQVWFPGCHSEIGGGYPDTGLSDITLAWMMSHLSAFLDFYPEYLRQQQALNTARLEAQHVPKGGLLWAASLLRDSARGFRALLGTAWRTPGQYVRMDRATVRPLKGNPPLQNTNEQIHVAVRSRMTTGGLVRIGLFSTERLKNYDPNVLVSDYKLENPGADPGEARWAYDGHDARFRGKVLEEAKLGVYEKESFHDHVTARS